MGWDFHHEIAPYDRKQICRARVSGNYEVIKDAMVGTTWYAAIKNKETGEVFASIVLTKIDRNGYCNFGMKWIDEECGPYHHDCPASILDLLTPTTSQYAQEWRERCRAHIQEKKEAGEDVLRTAPIGAHLEVTIKTGEVRRVVKMAPSYQFKTFWLRIENECRYLPKKYVKSAKIA